MKVIKFNTDYNIDEVTPPTSLIVSATLFGYCFAWCQIDIFKDYCFSNNFSSIFFKNIFLNFIISECLKIKNKIIFSKMKNIKLFLKNNFIEKNGLLIYEVY